MTDLRLYPVFIMLAAGGSGCSNDISEIKAITDPQTLPVQTTLNGTFVFTEHGKTRNKLMATRLDRYSGEKEFLEASEGFTMIFFDSTGAEEARLSAIHGHYDQEQKRLMARGQVELFNIKGEKLETEELFFIQDSALIRTHHFVTITTRSGVIYGHGLVSNDSFTRYRILRPSGQLYVEPTPQP